MRGNPDPHFPILPKMKCEKTAQVLIHLPLYDHGRRLQTLPSGNFTEPILDYPGPFHERRTAVNFFTIAVDHAVVGKGRANFRVTIKKGINPPVETRQHGVVAMQKMDQFTPGAVQAGLKIPQASPVEGLLVITDPAPAYPLHQGPQISIGTTIVNYLNLHLIRSRVLNQHTFERGFEIPKTVVSRDHDRPPGPADLIPYRPDDGRSLRYTFFVHWLG